jgi:hypothetical protein
MLQKKCMSWYRGLKGVAALSRTSLMVVKDCFTLLRRVRNDRCTEDTFVSAVNQSTLVVLSLRGASDKPINLSCTVIARS